MQHAHLRRQRSVKRLADREPVFEGTGRADCPHQARIAAADNTLIGINAGPKEFSESCLESASQSGAQRGVKENRLENPSYMRSRDVITEFPRSSWCMGQLIERRWRLLRRKFLSAEGIQRANSYVLFAAIRLRTNYQGLSCLRLLTVSERAVGGTVHAACG